MSLAGIACLSMMALLAPGPSRPAAPRFVLPPSVRTAGEPIRLLVWSEPHEARRAVIAEAWIVESETDVALQRASSEPADDERKLFMFSWHPLDPGSYLLYARVLGRRGITYQGAPHHLEVR